MGSNLIVKVGDIVCTSREILEKFIRELHRLTTYVNTWRYEARLNKKDEALAMQNQWFHYTGNGVMKIVLIAGKC